MPFKDLKRKQLAASIAGKQLLPIDKLGQRLKDFREALGMTQKQLAKRLKISQSAVSQIEENILSSTLKTITKITAALDCELLGTISSRLPLEKRLLIQAEKVAKRMLNRTFSNMAMEKQAPTKEAYNYQLKKLVNELIADPGPELWEE